MPVKNIIPGHRISKEKLQRSKELRRDMTPAEKILWNELRANKLGVHFRRQQIIAGFIVDFYCHPLRPYRGTSPKYDIGTLDNYQVFILSYLGEEGWGLKWMETFTIYNNMKMPVGRRFCVRWG